MEENGQVFLTELPMIEGSVYVGTSPSRRWSFIPFPLSAGGLSDSPPMIEHNQASTVMLQRTHWAGATLTPGSRLTPAGTSHVDFIDPREDTVRTLHLCGIHSRHSPT